jgi:hypothetical protein
MKLDNIKKGWITTIFGVLFLAADLVYLLVPFFLEKEVDTSSTTILVIAMIGVGLTLSPDDLYGVLKRRINNGKQQM